MFSKNKTEGMKHIPSAIKDCFAFYDILHRYAGAPKFTEGQVQNALKLIDSYDDLPKVEL